MRVAVTGGSGSLGRAVVPALAAAPEITAVRLLDPATPPADLPAEHRAVDITDPDLGAALADSDALVHLAFVVHRGGPGRPRSRRRMRRINVLGSRNAFRAAARAGVGTVIHLSSAAVYGAWPDNPARLGEAAPLRPNPGFAYAEDKVAAEAELAAAAAAHPRLRTVALRPPAILGPHALPLLRRLLTSPVRPAGGPPLQCVHEDDVAAAIRAALTRDVRGPFNLAAEPPLTPELLAAATGRRPRALPAALLQALQRAAWPVTGAWGEPGWGAGLRHPLLLETARVRRELAWSPGWSATECVAATLGKGPVPPSRGGSTMPQ
ncbi:MAG: NAD-dependent epimerase/dehydratase family protein [Thiohalospira sp.]